MREERPVGKECAAGYKYNPGVWLSIACKIGNRERAAFFQHQIQNNDIRLSAAQVSDGFALFLQNNDILTIPAEMACPNSGQVSV